MFGQRLIAEHKLLQIMRIYIYIDPAKMREKCAAAVAGSGPRHSELFPNISILGGWFLPEGSPRENQPIAIDIDDSKSNWPLYFYICFLKGNH